MLRCVLAFRSIHELVGQQVSSRDGPVVRRRACGLSVDMKFKKIKYTDLNSRQKEIFNFQKVAGVLAEYGFNCIKLADDWQGADFLAYHKDGKETLKIQLKSRLTIDKKYQGKNLYMAFPLSGAWCLINHEELVKLIGKSTNWLKTDSWLVNGSYSSNKPNQKLLESLQDNILHST